MWPTEHYAPPVTELVPLHGKIFKKYFARASGESANNTHQLSWDINGSKSRCCCCCGTFSAHWLRWVFLPGKFSLKSFPVTSAHATIVNVLSCADGFNQAALFHKIYIAFEIMTHSPSGFRKSILDFFHFATLVVCKMNSFRAFSVCIFFETYDI